jgi:hypothetical protein
MNWIEYYMSASFPITRSPPGNRDTLVDNTRVLYPGGCWRSPSP